MVKLSELILSSSLAGKLNIALPYVGVSKVTSEGGNNVGKTHV